MKNKTKANMAGASGSAVATTGGILGLKAAVSGLGAVVGVSGAGITSGLAAVGGGSMLTGLALSTGGVAFVAVGGYIGAKVIYNRITSAPKILVS